MKTAQITYYGEGPLNLQMRRFKSGKSVKARLDDILPDERRRYQDRFLVTGPDGLIINIGSMVPDEVAKVVIGNNPQVLRVIGFDVRIPPGYALDDSGSEPKVVEASVMAAKQTAMAVKDPPKEKPNLTIVRDEEDEGDGSLEPNEDGEIVSNGTVLGKLEEGDKIVDVREPTLEMTIPVEESGPTLTDEPPEEPKPVAAKKKKSAKKKSKVDSLLEEF